MEIKYHKDPKAKILNVEKAIKRTILRDLSAFAAATDVIVHSSKINTRLSRNGICEIVTRGNLCYRRIKSVWKVCLRTPAVTWWFEENCSWEKPINQLKMPYLTKRLHVIYTNSQAELWEIQGETHKNSLANWFSISVRRKAVLHVFQ